MEVADKSSLSYLVERRGLFFSFKFEVNFLAHGQPEKLGGNKFILILGHLNYYKTLLKKYHRQIIS